MNLEALIAAMKQRQAELAAEAMKTPGMLAENGLFQYGRQCGIYQGLEEAIELINGQLEEKDESAEKSQSPPRGYFA